jgi:hypothetical protein
MKNKRADLMVLFSVLKRVKKIPPSGGDMPVAFVLRW